MTQPTFSDDSKTVFRRIHATAVRAERQINELIYQIEDMVRHIDNISELCLQDDHQWDVEHPDQAGKSPRILQLDNVDTVSEIGLVSVFSHFARTANTSLKGYPDMVANGAITPQAYVSMEVDNRLYTNADFASRDMQATVAALKEEVTYRCGRDGWATEDLGVDALFEAMDQVVEQIAALEADVMTLLDDEGLRAEISAAAVL